jgi:hypothetical protein
MGSELLLILQSLCEIMNCHPMVVRPALLGMADGCTPAKEFPLTSRLMRSEGVDEDIESAVFDY